MKWVWVAGDGWSKRLYLKAIKISPSLLFGITLNLHIKKKKKTLSSYFYAKLLKQYINKFNGLSLPSCPLWKYSLFLAAGKQIHNDTRLDKNVAELGHILNSNEEMFSFHELREKFGLNNLGIFQYLQLKSIMHSFVLKILL